MGTLPAHRRRPAAEEHVATWALGLLAGQLEEVMDDLRAQAALLPADQRDGLKAAARHLVCDRLDITGARWGPAGAEAILKLRAVTANGDLDQYWADHLNRENPQRSPGRTRPHNLIEPLSAKELNPCSIADGDKLTDWLAVNVAHAERQPERVPL